MEGSVGLHAEASSTTEVGATIRFNVVRRIRRQLYVLSMC